MNSAPEPKKDKLDRLLDESLSNLPDRQAPDALLVNVMARIAVEEEPAQLSWFTRLRWPVVAISSCFVFLASYYSKTIFASLVTRVKTGQFAGEIEDVNLGIQLLSTLGNACAKVFGLIPSPLLYGVLAAALLFSAVSCAGFGTVLFRLTRSSDSMTT